MSSAAVIVSVVAIFVVSRIMIGRDASRRIGHRMVRVAPAHIWRRWSTVLTTHHRQLGFIVISASSVGTAVALLDVVGIVIILLASFLAIAIVRVLGSIP
jgi:isoprenylcysteine carboxyl methyltransferase (ICMT) family protein YpbQ